MCACPFHSDSHFCMRMRISFLYSYAHFQFCMRMCTSFWYAHAHFNWIHAHAHLIFVYACASHFGMRMSISFVCTCASHLRVRMLVTIWYAHAHLILGMRMRNSFLYRSVFAVTASTKLCQVFSNVHYSQVWKAIKGRN